MDIWALIGLLIVIGLIFYVVSTLGPAYGIPPVILTTIHVVLVVIVILMLLRLFGLDANLPSFRR